MQLKRILKSSSEEKKIDKIRGRRRNHSEEIFTERKRDLELGISIFRRIVALRAKRTRTVKQTEVTF